MIEINFRVRGYFVDNDYGIKTFLIAIKNNVRLKKEMSTIENESKERLIIFNKILQIKPDLEFKFFDKLIKNFSKIMKNFAEIITMIDKELKSIDEIFSKNATIHILIKNLFSDNVEKDTLNNIIQGIYIELLNVNVKIKIYNDT